MTDGFEQFQAAEGGPVTANIDGAEVVAEKVVLIRRYNAPSIHRPTCRYAKYPHAGRDLVTLTDAMRGHVLDGWLKACGTCKPTS